MGPRDLENGTVEVARRDTLEKNITELDGVEDYIENLLEEIQNNIYKKAFDYRAEHITKVDSWDEFKEVLNNKGGFIEVQGTAEAAAFDESELIKMVALAKNGITQIFELQK